MRYISLTIGKENNDRAVSYQRFTYRTPLMYIYKNFILKSLDLPHQV